LHGRRERERKGAESHLTTRGEIDGHLRNAHQPHPGGCSDAEEQPEPGPGGQEQWATLGQYDFITIIEAPDEKTMAKVSVELGSRGTMKSQSLPAIPIEELASVL
jgi:GYD domain